LAQDSTFRLFCSLRLRSGFDIVMCAIVDFLSAVLATWAPELASMAIILVNLYFAMNQRAKLLGFFSDPLRRLNLLYLATIEYAPGRGPLRRPASPPAPTPGRAAVHQADQLHEDLLHGGSLTAGGARDEVRRLAAAEGSARPLLALLRDLKAAGLPTEPAGTAAVRALAARDDILGVTGALMLSDVRTNSMVTETIRLLCRTNGEMAAVELGRRILAEHGTYFFGPAVLDDLILAAGRLMLFDDVKAFFKHHLTVGRPSVTAYALAIHALGCRGAVSDAVDLFEDLKAKQTDTENIAPAWNSVLSVLTRNGRAERALTVFQANRPQLRALPCVALGLCQLAPDTFAEVGLWVPTPRRTLCPKHRKRERNLLSERAQGKLW